MGSDTRMKCRLLRSDGVMTVFFALLSVPFLAVFFLMIESARFQGIRSHIQQVTDMGNYSLFSEFEKKLLTDFDLFAVDGAYGTGDFSVGRINDRLQGFVRLNTEPAASGLKALAFDPWKVSSQEADITAYALLTDHGGEALYQEAVAYMRETAILGAMDRLLNWYEDAQSAQANQETYEKEKLSADREMEDLEKQEAERRKELEEQAAAQANANSDQVISPGSETGVEQPDISGGPAPEEEKKFKNPFPALHRLARKDILDITCPQLKISDASVRRSELASKRAVRKGTLAVKKKYGGLENNLIFREYLLDRFACCLDETKEGALKYELEYILAGKTSDRQNLKAAVQRLLLVREGCNYLTCSSDESMNAQAGLISAALIGWTGIPALVAVMKHALLLGWAYAESLMDVRGLMAGGKIPLVKTHETWKVSLENLADLNEMLEGGGNKEEDGFSYRGYLRILLNMQGIADQKRRALDMVERRVAAGSGLSGFKADHCIVAVKDEVSFTAMPLFSRVTGVFLGITGTTLQEKVSGGFSYLF